MLQPQINNLLVNSFIEMMGGERMGGRDDKGKKEMAGEGMGESYGKVGEG